MLFDTELTARSISYIIVYEASAVSDRVANLYITINHENYFEKSF